MKPSTTALIGAVMISGGWMSLPAVAFAGDAIAPAAAAPSEKGAEHRAAAAVNGQSGACTADAHGHAASCTCARCAASQAE